jgi:hypothetical protein
MKIAIIQHNYAFFGVGGTLDAAIADAREWVDRDEELDPNKLLRCGDGRLNDGDFCWEYVSDELADAIKEDGAAAYRDTIETNYGLTLTP